MTASLGKIISSLLRDHYPETVLRFQETSEYDAFLSQLIASVEDRWYREFHLEDLTIGMEITREILIGVLGCSRFDFVESLIVDHFPKWHSQMIDAGILRYEIINLVSLLEPFFDVFPLSPGSPSDPALSKVAISVIKDYRKSNIHHFF